MRTIEIFQSHLYLCYHETTFDIRTLPNVNTFALVPRCSHLRGFTVQSETSYSKHPAMGTPRSEIQTLMLTIFLWSKGVRILRVYTCCMKTQIHEKYCLHTACVLHMHNRYSKSMILDVFIHLRYDTGIPPLFGTSLACTVFVACTLWCSTSDDDTRPLFIIWSIFTCIYSDST